MLRTILLSTLFLIIFGCGTEPADTDTSDGRIVLDVAGRTVTAERLAPILEEVRGDSVMVERTITSLVNRYLILADASSRGLDSTRTFQLFTYERQREKLQTIWLEQVLSRKIVLPPDTVQQHYSRMGTLYIYTAITLADSDTADSLRQLVLDGEDMNSLAVQNTLNNLERAREGRVGPLDSTEVRAEDLSLLAGLEPGQISPVDSFYQGWRFVRLDSVYQDSLPPLSEVRDFIQARIEGRMRMAYKDVLLDSLRETSHLEVSPYTPELISSHFSPGSMEYQPFTPEEEEMMAYTFDGGGRTIYQLAENIRNLPPVDETDPTDPAWVRSYCRLIGVYDIMGMKAREEGMDTLTEVTDYLDQRVSNHLLDVYYAEVIEPRLVPDESEMMEVYEEYRDSLRVPEARIFRVISAVGDQQLDLLETTLNEGGDPFGMTDRLTRVENLLASDQDILTRPMYAGEIPRPYSDMLFDAELNETVICSVAVDRVMVFETVEVQPSRQATFDESYDEIQGLLRFQKEEEVLRGLVDSLASVYHIEIDRDFVEGYIHTPPPSQDAP